MAAQQLHDDEDFAAPDFVAGYAAHEWMAFQERVPDRGKIAPGGVRFHGRRTSAIDGTGNLPTRPAASVPMSGPDV